jgi:thymidylate kinase/D-ribose pyranose/furanose isomerase RbsD
MYKITKDLISKLKYNNIIFCHWKSNLLLKEALAGHDDLDLLIEKKHINKFESTIFDLGFKRATNINLEIQSVHHFYGYDSISGELLHLHVYYQIKTGPSWTKSLRFDFENHILNNLVIHESGMPIPEKHIELVIFVIRIMMKYTKVNEIILVSKESKRTIKELAYLQKGLDIEKLDLFLKLYFPIISKEFFFRCIEVIKEDGFLKKIICARQIKNKVSQYLYQSIVVNLFNNTNQLFYRVFNKYFYKEKKSLFSGGSLIVIAGLDATGKSTITSDLNKWLGKNFSVIESHFGKPPSTLLTFPINFLIKIIRTRTSLNNDLRSSVKSQNKKQSLIFMLRQLALAYDRFQLSKFLWSKSSKGNIILCDRYKSENFGVMDSKRLMLNNHIGLRKKIILKENSLYDSIKTPDILIYLTVPVDVAVERNNLRIKKGKETTSFLKQRHLENQNLKYKAKNYFNINTDQDYNIVINQIKTLIWDNL